MSAGVPPPPPGFTLDDQPRRAAAPAARSSLPPPPPGFKLDVKPAPKAAPRPAPRAAPKPAPRPAPAPARPQQARPAPKKPGGFSQRFGDAENAIGRTFQNIPGSAWNAATGLYDTVRHPIRSVEHLHAVTTGALEDAISPLIGRRDTARLRARDPAPANAWQQTKQGYKDRYGSGSKALRTLQTDPVGTALDASVVAGGASGLVRGGVRAAGRAAVGAEVGGVRGAARFALDREPITGKPSGWKDPKVKPAGVDMKRANAAAAKAGKAVPFVRQEPYGKEPGTARKLLRPVESKLSPGTVDPAARQMAPIQRQVLAKHRLDAERAASTLEKHQRVVGNASVADQRAVINAVESASRGGIDKLPKTFQPAARAIRDVSLKYRARIEQVLKANGAAGPSFVDDYYARMWKQTPGEVRAALSRQGSGRNLKARTIPTYQEGLDAGLKPAHENPLDGMTAYVDNMSRFLATHDLQTEMRVSGLAKWYPKGAVPDGWVKLNGMNTERELKPLTKDIEGLPVHTGNVPPRVLAAPEGAATIYNNYVDTGIKDPLFKVAEKGFNMQAGLKLAGSLFHPVLVGGKTVASDLTNAANYFLRGQPIKAVKSLAHMPIAPILTPFEGKRMGERLLAGDEAMNESDRLFVQAGGRVSGEQIYRSSIKPNFLKSAVRGTLLRDVKDAIGATTKGPLKERATAAADLGARVFDTLQAPTFQYYVPAVKRGVFEREMNQILARDPMMSDAAKAAEARKLLDNIDGRMGEMIRDNNFWSQSQMQVAKLMFLSPSWQIGDVRILADAAKELPDSAKMLLKGKGLSNGTAQAIGLAGSYFLMNGIANYLYTGQMPEGEDWAHFRTGGTNADGTPERAAVPSVMKDFFGAINDPMQEFINKLHPTLKMLYELPNNTDWKGDPIYKPAHATVDPEASRTVEIMSYLGDQFAPIGFADNPNGPNSGIGTGGKIMGLRPSGMAYTNPDKLESVLRYKGNTDWQRKLAHDRKAEMKKQPRGASPASAPAPAASSDIPPPPPGFTVDKPVDEKVGEAGGINVYADIKKAIPGVQVSSGYRTPEYQADMRRRGYRPANNSAHLSGSALDLLPPAGMSRAQLRAKVKALYPKARFLDEGDHLHVTFPGYYGAPVEGGAARAGIRNPYEGMPPPPPGFTIDAR